MLLGYYFWQRQFAADPAIVGQALELNNSPVTAVGVLPASFDFGSVFSPGLKVDVYVPGIMDLLRNDGNSLVLVGGLKPGATVAQAQAEVDILMPQIRAAHKDWYDDYATANDGAERSRQRKAAPLAGGVVVRGGIDTAECLRESVEPAAGPRRRAP